VSATYSTQTEVDAAPKAAGQFATFGSFHRRDLLRLLDAVEADLGELPFADREAKRYYFRGIRNRLLHDEPSPNPRCVALNTHLRLYPNGDVPTCQFNSRRVGNLRNQTFAEVWSSVTAAQQRDWVSQCPGCWAECEVLPNALYTGDLLASLLPGRRHGNRASGGKLVPSPAGAD
jgi:MoaA/NifB/PqqE/SkfB family radical SAM enzyme